MKNKQNTIKEDERRRREHAEAMSVRHSLTDEEQFPASTKLEVE